VISFTGENSAGKPAIRGRSYLAPVKTTWLWLVGRQLELFILKGKSRTALRRMYSVSKSYSCCVLFLRLAGTRNILLIKYYHVGNFVHRLFWNNPALMWTTLRVHWSEVMNRPLLWWLIFKSDNYAPSTLYKALCDYYYILKGNIAFSLIKKNLNLKPLSIRSFFLLYWIWYIWSIFLRNHQDIFDKLGHISHYLTRIVTFTHSAQCYYRLITKIKLLNIFIMS